MSKRKSDDVTKNNDEEEMREYFKKQREFYEQSYKEYMSPQTKHYERRFHEVNIQRLLPTVNTKRQIDGNMTSKKEKWLQMEKLFMTWFNANYWTDNCTLKRQSETALCDFLCYKGNEVRCYEVKSKKYEGNLNNFKSYKPEIASMWCSQAQLNEIKKHHADSKIIYILWGHNKESKWLYYKLYKIDPSSVYHVEMQG